MSELRTIGVRLAIRREGKFINAYLAPEDSMEGAMLMGSLLTTLAERSDATFEAFKQCMSGALAIAVEDIVGRTPEMVERQAPPHEKAGRA